MKKIVVAGSGVLGSQIAFQAAFHGYDVSIYDISDAVLEKAKQTLRGLAERYRADIGATQAQIDTAAGNIALTTDLATALADADLLIEAIPEAIAIKTEFYGKAGELAPEKTIFATNTSTLLPSQFAEATGRPAKFLALHFANEIWKRNTAEVMGHPGTDSQVFNAVVAFAKSIGMVALPLYKEQPGYITNSLIVPWVTAALKLWASGVAESETIDKTWLIATKSTFVPFGFVDMAGLNTAYNITSAMANATSDPVLAEAARRLKEEYLDKGKLGVSSGEGFYKYPNPAYLNKSFLS